MEVVIWIPGEGPEYGKRTETMDEVKEDEAGAVGFCLYSGRLAIQSYGSEGQFV